MLNPTIRMSWIPILLAVLLLVLLVALLSSGPALAAKDDNQGFLYGRVVTESGSEYTGFLRWGNQEAFWDDLFHSGKEDQPFYDYLDDDDIRDLRRERKFTLFKKWRVTVDDDDWRSTRMFISRFGDIAVIQPQGDGDAEVEMKNGTEYEVSGVADDVTSDIHVNDASLGMIDLDWDRIELIEFKPVPRDADPGVWRLHGKVVTDEGDFEGFIQWDKQECINTDVLDGDTDDGRVKIEMGRIRSIERRSRRSSDVVLKDGREFRLSGTNDVNHENRGIMVEDPRFGRVTIGWDAFEMVTFSDPGESGKGYDDYPPLGPLRGTVTDDDGDTYKGRIVYDLDESEGWEILNGDLGDVEFDIPFYRIASIEPIDSDESLIVLTNGEKLNLEDGQDVTESNAGILVFTKGNEVEYIAWKDVERIEFDHK
jgi:hypothetical protein